MSQQYSRPISGTTAAGAGATYVVLNRFAEKTSIQITVNGTVSDYDVDTTLNNIMSNPAAVNAPEGAIAPASATWIATDLNAESASGGLVLTTPFFALRLNLITGTGSLSYRILQTG